MNPARNRLFRTFGALLALLSIAAADARPPTEFRIEDPAADSMAVAGEFNDWQGEAMSRGEDGVWTFSKRLEPGDYAYKFVRNREEWLMDPENPRRKVVEGTENSMVRVLPVKTVVRQWTQAATGRTLEGTIIDADGDEVEIDTGDGRTVKIPPASLSDGDRDYILAWLDDRDAPGPKAPTGEGWAGRLVAGGEPIRFEIPVTTEVRHGPGEFEGTPKQPVVLEVSLSIPEDFDPQAADNWMAVVSSTSGADASSCNAMGMYWEACREKGVVCMAADILADEETRRTWSDMPRRWAVFREAVEVMSAEWPSLTGWTWVPMGFSGGGGYTMFFGACMSREKWKVGGMWMGGSSYRDQHFQQILRPRSAFYRIPLFASFGTADELIPEDSRERTIDWARKEMKAFRGELYDGGHDPYRPHMVEALGWFRELEAGSR